MKITKTTLKQLIKEELNKVFLEQDMAGQDVDPSRLAGDYNSQITLVWETIRKMQLEIDNLKSSGTAGNF